MLTFAGDVAPLAVTATYQSGVTRGVDGPRAPALKGFEADNRAAAFSGVNKGAANDRLTAELPTHSTGDYTVELWLYNTRDLSQPNSPAISGYVFSRPGTATGANAAPGDHLAIGGVESSPRDKLFFYDGETMVGGRTTLSINAWYHVALVRSGDEVKVYLNGDVQNPEIAANVPKRYDTARIMLGNRADGFAPFAGRLDEVAFFDSALSPERIAAHHAAAAGEAVISLAAVDNRHHRDPAGDGGYVVAVAKHNLDIINIGAIELPAMGQAGQEGGVDIDPAAARLVDDDVILVVRADHLQHALAVDDVNAGAGDEHGVKGRDESGVIIGQRHLDGIDSADRITVDGGKRAGPTGFDNRRHRR